MWDILGLLLHGYVHTVHVLLHLERESNAHGVSAEALCVCVGAYVAGKTLSIDLTAAAKRSGARHTMLTTNRPLLPTLSAVLRRNASSRKAAGGQLRPALRSLLSASTITTRLRSDVARKLGSEGWAVRASDLCWALLVRTCGGQLCDEREAVGDGDAKRVGLR